MDFFNLRRWLWVGLAALVLLHGSPVFAGEVTVAVASNFMNPFKQLVQDFQKSSGHRVHIVSGSTGKLYAQIIHGAPYDVFLAADSRRPRLLEREGQAVPATRFTYARGKIVLWSADRDRIGPDGEQFLRRRNFKHLALANPKTAPYGKAAAEVLQRLGLWKSLIPFIVRGENIGQTFQFIATGNAEAGFVALSQLRDPRLTQKGSHWKVPEHLYDPIDQDAVLLKPGQSKPGARELMRFLQSEPARILIQSYGYGLKTP